MLSKEVGNLTSLFKTGNGLNPSYPLTEMFCLMNKCFSGDRIQR
ncbi:hypothetical protein [Nostoc sp.]